ncbi:FG-GAP-like repeat-containing protein [Desulforhabdus amnigena]|uniref:VCBS repeat-containing protein n=1 Tax=Desulforhabdus amnigena TaxID=40218 RepID=A0A9W6D373_9BACT|nr:FG-GAP-like repeat-containing protein [Desulforhabdus amnigena]NLJ29638.1 hypothetical protein [Deltaproteobacteria bacterium]GLI34074.1 hypothetical protein DAMNIGENAA_15070 [Desulforhabdus amnigena]
MLHRKFFCKWIILALLLSGASGAGAAEDSQSPVKVAILPFSMHAPSDLAYLQDGIRDMLASRLAWQGKVQVVDRAATTQALHGSKADLSLGEAVKIGSSLKADYVLFGSITAVGQSVSIDAKMAPVSGTGEPLPLYAQTRTLDDVVPQINQFAQQINQKVFSRTTESPQASEADTEESMANRNPELLVPGTMQSGDKISYLNPNFIEVTPESSLRQSGIWRSQTFKGGIVGMDIGDLDGDGVVEVVTVTANELTVYRRQAQGMKTIARFNGDNVDRFLWVSLVDTDRDGKDEIYVTNLRKFIKTRPGGSENIYGADSKEELASFGFTFIDGKLQPSFKNAPYFLNGVELPKRGKVLLGQAKGSVTEGPFRGDIYEMQMRAGDLAALVPANLPSRCNVFNFARADINGDHSDETILIDSSNEMLILNSSGDQIWKGDRLFGATTNYFEAKVEDRRYNSVDVYAIPSPILITDLNKDGIPEIVVNRSRDILAKFLPNSMKYFDKSEIVSLSWDQLGLVENWKTRDISGMVTAIRIADMNHDGNTELVGSLVLAKDFLKLWESKSTLFSYDLNVSPQNPAKQ